MAYRNYYRGEKMRGILEWATSLYNYPDEAMLSMYVEVLTYSLEEEIEESKRLLKPPKLSPF